MDNEIKEKIKELLDTVFENAEKKIGDNFKEAVSKPCKIHIDNDGVGTQLAVSGARLSLLITLAGAENKILNSLNCTEDEFNCIKSIVGTEEATNNE